MTGLAGLTAVSRPAQRLRVPLHHRAQGRYPGAQAKPFKARPDRLQASSIIACGVAVSPVVFLFMALPFSVDSTPRAYRLKAGNAAPLFQHSKGVRHAKLMSAYE